MQPEQIFQVEEYFERGFQQVFENAGIASVFRSREKRDAQTPWVEVKFLTGTITEKHVHIIQPDNECIYAAWTGSRLELTTATQRQNNGAQHKILIGKLRAECQMYRLRLSWRATEAASVHVPVDLREEGTVHTIDSDNDLDFTTLTFHVLHNIVDSAFGA